MRTWKRTPFACLCGLCGETVLVGKPVLEIRVTFGSARTPSLHIRCEKCLGPAPPDLPPLVERAIEFAPICHILTGPGALPFDFKTRGAGREPGEDD